MVLQTDEICVGFFFFQAEDGIRDLTVTGVQTCALPISLRSGQADEISRALDELQQAYSAAGASLYAAQRGAGGGPAPGAEQPSGAEPAGEKKENVVDADYEIVDDDKKK